MTVSFSSFISASDGKTKTTNVSIDDTYDIKLPKRYSQGFLGDFIQPDINETINCSKANQIKTNGLIRRCLNW